MRSLRTKSGAAGEDHTAWAQAQNGIVPLVVGHKVNKDGISRVVALAHLGNASDVCAKYGSALRKPNSRNVGRGQETSGSEVNKRQMPLLCSV